MRKEKSKKISTSVPEQLLRRACELTELNQTDALIAGLRELVAQHERRSILDLKGKINLNLDVNKLRDRVRL